MKTNACGGCWSSRKTAIDIVKDQSFSVPAEYAGKTVAAILRIMQPGQSWSQVRKLVETRRVKINGELWLDDARRLKEGDTVEILARSEKTPELDRKSVV